MKLTKLIGLSILLFSASSFAITSSQKAIDTLQQQIANVQTETNQALSAQQAQTQKAISDLQMQMTNLQNEMQQIQAAVAKAKEAATEAPVVTATPGVTEPAEPIVPAPATTK